MLRTHLVFFILLAKNTRRPLSSKFTSFDCVGDFLDVIFFIKLNI